MHPLNQQLQNPLTRAANQHDREEILTRFPDLQDIPDGRCLALRRYVVSHPDRFFDQTAYDYYLRWLRNRARTDRELLQEYLTDNESELARALHFLREINLQDWHDRLLEKADDYEHVRFVDRHIHPAYLRLIEGVFVHFTRCLAFFSRRDRGKGTDGLELWSVVQEVDRLPAAALTDPYRHTVRNAIAHGGITYRENRIKYVDKNGKEEELDAIEVIRLCDDMVDVCNGIVAAFKVFCIAENTHYDLPKELLLDELREETRSPWWQIDGCIPTETAKGSQLLVYAKPNSRDSGKIHMATVQSGILAESLAPGFDRYFFSLRSSKALPGWAAFDGKKLATLRKAPESNLESYKGILEDDLLFYSPHLKLPRWLCRLDTLLQSFRIQWALAWKQQRKERQIPTIICRGASVHRNGWRLVLRGHVFLPELEVLPVEETIRTWRRRITRVALKEARRNSPGIGLSRFLPLGYSRISVIRKDFRKRRLASFGLSKDLVCTVQLQKINRIKSPDILGSTIETHGPWRIAWNRSWRIEEGQQVSGGNGE
ncbi:hypothetical protein ACFPK9_06820 [Rubritalea spongiae]|uniref:Apea-like HEPN domain-containing protein n=1 Tax=Rubritalea spongiae TaxID=430797 RepID=A0ABW5E3V5_9BACT